VLNHSDAKDVDEAVEKGEDMHQRILIVMKKGKPHVQVCVNCKKPKCVDACEYDAIEKLEDGTVVMDDEKCTGCWKCIEACPFDAVCALDERNISIKCDLCGGGDFQACVDACPTQALFVKISE
jgi:carbon-monoxide dehydrogenase iron sulfur subunit